MRTCCSQCGRKLPRGQEAHFRCDRCKAILREKNRVSRERAAREMDDDTTEEELDRIIAEQRKCLPPWWNRARP